MIDAVVFVGFLLIAALLAEVLRVMTGGRDA